MGGLDARVIISNDRAKIDAELEEKIPAMKGGHNYFIHSDHSIPATVDFETYKYFIDKALSLGRY